jgi:predicted esterase
MIAATAADARAVLARVLADGPAPSQVLVAGYSMGAQVALMVAAGEPRVTHVVSIVPPFVDASMGPVAPMNVVGQVRQPWLLLSASEDPFATSAQNLALLETGGSAHKEHRSFPGGHALPREWVEAVEHWLGARPGAHAHREDPPRPAGP